MKQNLIITIGREYGSGGREIGEKVASALNIPYYDRKIIDMAAQKTGFHADFIANEEHRVTGSFLFNIATGGYLLGGMNPQMGLSLTDQVYHAECDVIKKVASEGSCVIVGRCADYVLREDFTCFNIFIHAAFDHRCERIMAEYSLSRDKAAETVRKTDKNRTRHYQYYTNRGWGAAENYDMTLDSGRLGIDSCVRIITDAVNML
ncbi:MAG: cytidylate kinase-like family protein [Clostridia bacterium]|nr:cytidylate kinase-like family protein [Clostridia bacterium]